VIEASEIRRDDDAYPYPFDCSRPYVHRLRHRHYCRRHSDGPTRLGDMSIHA